MPPFYQGKLDVFCAVYAVLNGFRQLHGISAWQAKTMFADLLVRLPEEDPERWRACVRNQTDYCWLVEYLLRAYSETFPVRWVLPWGHAGSAEVSPHEFWQTLSLWLEEGQTRTALFRFHRFVPEHNDPVVSHWTTADKLLGETLFLYDSSREENALHSLEFGEFVTRRKDCSLGRCVQVEPESLFLLTRS